MNQVVSLAPEFFLAEPNPLAADYTRFRVGERLLLTGHSHQAWPDCAFSGQMQAFEDAATEVDRKWERAFMKAGAVRDGFRRILWTRSAKGWLLKSMILLPQFSCLPSSTALPGYCGVWII